MSKVIKQMEMDALTQTFQKVRDLVVLSVKGLDCHADHALRSKLRKKNIRLQVVKNSLTRRVFGELGMKINPESPYWRGPTVVAFGASSIAELSRAVESELKAPKTAGLYKEKVVVKGAIFEGQEVSFKQALEMPTHEEVLGQIVAMILGPASALAGCLTGPASQVASQIQKIAEKEPEAKPPEPAAPAAG
jgi:large subunit ribosomal protein L10